MKTKMTVTLVTMAMAGVLPAGAALAERGHGWEHGPGGWERGEDGPRQGMRRPGMRLEGLLETFDSDGDGRLTQEEIDTARAERLRSFDADGDGMLSLAEYEALWMQAMRERMVDQFQAHDDDGDGQVTVEEFGERFEDVVRRGDVNGDGVLSEDDRATAMQRPRRGRDDN